MLLINKYLVSLLLFLKIITSVMYDKKSVIHFRIVGGSEAKIEEFPFMASIQKKLPNGYKPLCGGTILDNQSILTAAHCVCSRNTSCPEPSDRFVILVGVSNTILQNIYKKYDINSITVHPEFYLPSKYNDIAVLKLNNSLDFNNKIQPVTLAFKDMFGEIEPADYYSNDFCTVAGYGQHTLKKVNLSLIKNSKCDQYLANNLNFNKYMRSTQFCTLVEGNDACGGDSGGPLMCNGYQIGIVSWGLGCGLKESPGVWTRVDKYYDWLNSMIDIRTSIRKRQAIASHMHEPFRIVILLIFIVIVFLK